MWCCFEKESSLVFINPSLALDWLQYTTYGIRKNIFFLYTDTLIHFDICATFHVISTYSIFWLLIHNFPFVFFLWLYFTLTIFGRNYKNNACWQYWWLCRVPHLSNLYAVWAFQVNEWFLHKIWKEFIHWFVSNIFQIVVASVKKKTFWSAVAIKLRSVTKNSIL